MVHKRLCERPGLDPEVIGANRSLQQVLAQLAEAEACARRTGCNPWEFAVELEILIAEGLTANDLRWLVKTGYVEHAHEITHARETARRFRSCCNLGFSKRTCFVLTSAGALLAAAHGPPPQDSSDQPLSAVRILGSRPDHARCIPSWDSNRRVLYVDNRVVKQFKVPSSSQEAILAAFEEEAGPRRSTILCPLIQNKIPSAGCATRSRVSTPVKRILFCVFAATAAASEFFGNSSTIARPSRPLKSDG